MFQKSWYVAHMFLGKTGLCYSRDEWPYSFPKYNEAQEAEDRQFMQKSIIIVLKKKLQYLHLSKGRKETSA